MADITDITNINPPAGLNSPVAGKPPLTPIASILSAIGEYTPSPVPRFMDRVERAALEFFANPGAGRLGMAHGRFVRNLPRETLSLIRRLREDGMSLAEIGRRTNLSRTGVRNVLHNEWNMSTSSPVPTVVGRINEINEMRGRGLSIQEIADNLNTTRYSIYRVLRDVGQPMGGAGRTGRTPFNQTEIRDPGLGSMIRESVQRLENTRQTPEQIARYLNETYDARVTPEQISSRTAWFFPKNISRGPIGTMRDLRDLPPSPADRATTSEASILTALGDHRVHSFPGVAETQSRGGLPPLLGSGYGDLNPRTRIRQWPPRIEDQDAMSPSRLMNQLLGQ